MALFRQQALKRITSPDQLDQLVPVTSPRGWIGLAALLVVVAAAIVWGFLGTVESTLTAQGILLRKTANMSVDAPIAGQVVELNAPFGERVPAGQVLARIQGANNRAVEVKAPSPGRVVEVPARLNSFVQFGQSLLVLEPLDEPLEAVVYLPDTVGSQVRPGMTVEVSPSNAPPQEFGFIEGRVRTVSPFPVSQRHIQDLTGNEGLATQIVDQVGLAPVEIHVDLTADKNTPSGFKWSSPHGFPGEVSSGALASGTVVLRRQPPVSLIIP